VETKSRETDYEALKGNCVKVNISLMKDIYEQRNLVKLNSFSLLFLHPLPPHLSFFLSSFLSFLLFSSVLPSFIFFLFPPLFFSFLLSDAGCYECFKYEKNPEHTRRSSILWKINKRI
jgi:hypothetical protein